jgi:hypothetical protein
LHHIVDRLYTVDTGRRTLIFHPKLYLVRGSTQARMIIGSANLTLASLNNNIEAGMLLNFDLTDALDKAEIDKVEMLFSTSLTDYPRNIVQVSGIDTLDELLNRHRLIDEKEQSLGLDDVDRTDASELTGAQQKAAGESGVVPRMRLKTKPLRSGFARSIPLFTKVGNEGSSIVTNELTKVIEPIEPPMVTPITPIRSSRPDCHE